MEKIESFKVNHLKLERGIYVSRRDNVGNGVAVTFDIRMRKPYEDAPMTGRAMHTIEHIGATWLRNKFNNVVYFGPMGCKTGFYLILAQQTERSMVVSDIKRHVLDMFRFISMYEGPIPGDSRMECGNSEYHDLDMAREYANDFLDAASEDKLHYEYEE